jgi:predicted nucleic acid-binding protein
MKVDRLVGTDFLIDRWRDGEASDAAAYARAHEEEALAIAWIVKGEFLRAAAVAGRDSPELLEFFARYPTQWPDEEVIVGYARLGAVLHQRNLSLGVADLWLAAATLRLGVPLVTRDPDGLGRVPGIKIDAY